MSPRAAYHKQLLDAVQARLNPEPSEPRGKIGVGKTWAKFIAKECDERVAQDASISHRRIVKTFDLYDLREHQKSRIYDPVNNPMGDVEPFSDTVNRVMPGLLEEDRFTAKPQPVAVVEVVSAVATAEPALPTPAPISGCQPWRCRHCQKVHPSWRMNCQCVGEARSRQAVSA